jgi:hypothetical protein
MPQQVHLQQQHKCPLLRPLMFAFSPCSNCTMRQAIARLSGLPQQAHCSSSSIMAAIIKVHYRHHPMLPLLVLLLSLLSCVLRPGSLLGLTVTLTVMMTGAWCSSQRRTSASASSATHAMRSGCVIQSGSSSSTRQPAGQASRCLQAGA